MQRNTKEFETVAKLWKIKDGFSNTLKEKSIDKQPTKATMQKANKGKETRWVCGQWFHISCHIKYQHIESNNKWGQI